MRLKELAKICKNARKVYLFDDGEGPQWAGTESAFWKLPESLGRMTPESLCAVFDFTADQIGKMELSEKPLPNFDISDFSEGEKDLLYWMSNRLILNGKDILPLTEPGGEVFCVQTQYLSPGKDAEVPMLSARKIQSTGTPYIAFKDGMFVCGIVAPMYPAPESVKWLADVLGGITVK